MFLLREEHRLRVLKNWLLRKMFHPKRGQGNRGLEKTA
jgi:hypothetical protein